MVRINICKRNRYVHVDLTGAPADASTCVVLSLIAKSCGHYLQLPYTIEALDSARDHTTYISTHRKSHQRELLYLRVKAKSRFPCSQAGPIHSLAAAQTTKNLSPSNGAVCSRIHSRGRNPSSSCQRFNSLSSPMIDIDSFQSIHLIKRAHQIIQAEPCRHRLSIKYATSAPLIHAKRVILIAAPRRLLPEGCPPPAASRQAQYHRPSAGCSLDRSHN